MTLAFLLWVLLGQVNAHEEPLLDCDENLVNAKVKQWNALPQKEDSLFFALIFEIRKSIRDCHFKDSVKDSVYAPDFESRARTHLNKAGLDLVWDAGDHRIQPRNQYLILNMKGLSPKLAKWLAMDSIQTGVDAAIVVPIRLLGEIALSYEGILTSKMKHDYKEELLKTYKAYLELLLYGSDNTLRKENAKKDWEKDLDYLAKHYPNSLASKVISESRKCPEYNFYNCIKETIEDNAVFSKGK